ncbi:uncharacterized protein [Salminus brasiliensis]|uniref:uncharacterized protein n=1 Tax=Salminus brasiliensis TaxID=930266 RepID=UPI003B82D585
MSPFECQFGYSPPLFEEQEMEVGVPSAVQLVRRCRRTWQKARATLLATLRARKRIADRGASDVDIACPDELKVIQKGENVSLTCSFSYSDAPVISWLKKTPGEQPVLITSSVISFAQFYNDFEKSGRFHASQGKSSFTLNILHAEPSDSVTYICAASYYSNIALSDCTVLVLKGATSSHYTVLQHAASDPVQLGGNTTLQCSILTNNSAEDHSVYWFRHGSGDSHPGLIYTHENRSDQCEKRSETGSSTQSCIYKLPKKNLSPSDAGTYYCAVAACGEILFGNGTKLNFTEDTGDLNYAGLSFSQPPSSRRNKAKNRSDQPVYAQVKIHQ